MSLTLTKEPIIGVSGKTSKWNCASNPIVYKFQRKDYSVNAYANNGGFVRIQVSSVDITSQIAVNDYIYLNDVQYTGKHKVTAVSFSTHTYITIDVTYVSTTTSFGYFNILKRTYRCKIELFNSDNSLLFSSLQFSDDSTGLVTAFVDTGIKKFLSIDNTADYTSNFDFVDDSGLYKNFYIKYSELINGVEGSQSAARSIYAVYGSRQIGDSNGGNLVDYVVLDTAVADPPLCKFLTKFDTITYVRGWPNTISILLNLNGTVQATSCVIDFFTSSGSYLSSSSVNITSGLAPKINLKKLIGSSTADIAHLSIMQITENYTFLNYEFVSDLSDWDQPNSATVTDDWYWITGLAQRKHETQSTIAILSHSSSITPSSKARIRTKFQGFVAGDYTMKVYFVQSSIAYLAATYVLPRSSAFLVVDDLITSPAGSGSSSFTSVYFSIEGDEAVGNKMSVYYFDVSVSVIVSETKNIVIKDACKNPVLLNFRNSLGGDAFWMFEHNQEMTWDNTVKKAKRKVLYAESINTNEWDALNDLSNVGFVYSENIVDIVDSNKTSKMLGQQIYQLDQSGNKTGVITLQTKNSTNTKDSKHNFQIEIEYPEYFVQ